MINENKIKINFLLKIKQFSQLKKIRCFGCSILQKYENKITLPKKKIFIKLFKRTSTKKKILNS